jgi:hypothetical protein
MKKIILLSIFIITSNLYAQSADYSCELRQYRLDLNLRQDRSTHLWVRDYHGVIFQSFAGFVEKKGTNSHYHFYPAHSDPAVLILRTQDTIDLPNKLTGTINTKLRGFLIRDTFNCVRR